MKVFPSFLEPNRLYSGDGLVMQPKKGDSKSLALDKHASGYKSDMKRAAGHDSPPFKGKGQRLIERWMIHSRVQVRFGFVSPSLG